MGAQGTKETWFMSGMKCRMLPHPHPAEPSSTEVIKKDREWRGMHVDTHTLPFTCCNNTPANFAGQLVKSGLVKRIPETFTPAGARTSTCLAQSLLLKAWSPCFTLHFISRLLSGLKLLRGQVSVSSCPAPSVHRDVKTFGIFLVNILPTLENASLFSLSD